MSTFHCNQYEQILTTTISRIDQQGTKLGIMVVILPTGNVDHYKKAKEIMLNRPVAVQAVLARLHVNIFKVIILIATLQNIRWQKSRIKM